ncbi:ribosomal RNA processing protein 36 homolog [Protopterus annectens]|uniref:ribosomal RNA processing protein 36 homolog n=1 Tax=Protopterus annectens TaxID=7888 RepID=UPI001CFA400D|nr:ribosomal RNA processing protein 36 homolog [Protopterus annectens]
MAAKVKQIPQKSVGKEQKKKWSLKSASPLRKASKKVLHQVTVEKISSDTKSTGDLRSKRRNMINKGKYFVHKPKFQQNLTSNHGCEEDSEDLDENESDKEENEMNAELGVQKSKSRHSNIRKETKEDCSETSDENDYDSDEDGAESDITESDGGSSSSEVIDQKDDFKLSGSQKTEDIKTANEDIRKELSSMSFEEILQLQNKIGTKLYSQVVYGTESTSAADKKKCKRQNKNRPIEISAKKPVPFLRPVVAVKKRVSRDPRFDDLSGEYRADIFEKTYAFVDDIKMHEKTILQKKIKKAKSQQKKKELQQLLERMVHQENVKKQKQIQHQRELEFKKQQRERAQQGKRPFFLKKSDKRKLELADKYRELKKSGKLDSFLSKKRKRNALKDRRKLPFKKHA